MDFFGFGNPSTESTPIANLIRHATDGLLLTSDWTKNISICDFIEAGNKDVSIQATRALTRRLQESNPNTIYLTLVVVGTCMNNCSLKFASSIDRAFMDELSNVCRGNKGKRNSEEALQLIQQWTRTFEFQRQMLPIFFDTYTGLKARGVKFPPERLDQQQQEARDNHQRGAPSSYVFYWTSLILII